MRISDWSSDVCSSDLREFGKVGAQISRLVDQRDELPRDDRLNPAEAFADLREQMVVERAVMLGKAVEIDILAAPRQADIVARAVVVEACGEVDVEVVFAPAEIGRASCRERVCQYV